MKERDIALSKFKETKHTSDWIEYKRLRNFIVAAVRQEKVRYLMDRDQKVNKKELWDALNKPNVKTKKSYFLSVFSPLNYCVDAATELRNKLFNGQTTFSFNLRSVDEINQIINNLKSNAASFDGLTTKMLKLCSRAIDKYLMHIVNCCLDTGYYPEEWKTALVCSLLKVSKPKSFSDLRLITGFVEGFRKSCE
ncbi:hypothetical protein Zmor_027009 [Zophobas morio]|uniref:Uncharacterized protein n=1 Tax=Zophobas morio TaxID=2755281 RepID=A0AA38HVJ6_9CUCU|nr:hypothetical protein Zmor_027009 [Zophobas morio]